LFVSWFHVVGLAGYPKLNCDSVTNLYLNLMDSEYKIQISGSRF